MAPSLRTKDSTTPKGGAAVAAVAELSDARLRKALSRAQVFFEQHRSDRRPDAFLQKRGLSAERLPMYGIGYAPDDWDALLAAVNDPPAAAALGLSGESKSGQPYARFRDRLMLPIHEQDGALVGFAGRLLPGNNDQRAKYYNSPESRLFKKGAVLYGLHQARSAQVKGDNNNLSGKLPQVIVVEGYTDVLAGMQHGYPHCVATMGTAMTSVHAEKLATVADEVVLCADGDQAGRRAIDRSLGQLAPYYCDGFNVRVAQMPDGLDPDELLRDHGHDAFQSMLDDAPTMDTYLATRHFDPNRSYVYAFADIAPYVEQMVDPIKQSETVLMFSALYPECEPAFLVDNYKSIQWLGDNGTDMNTGQQPGIVEQELTPELAREAIPRALYSAPDMAASAMLDVLKGYRFTSSLVDQCPEVQLMMDVARQYMGHTIANSDDLLTSWMDTDGKQDYVVAALSGRMYSRDLAADLMRAGAEVLLADAHETLEQDTSHDVLDQARVLMGS